ncbi:MAG: YggT family protein [Eubacteriales bacterium]
MQDEKSKTTVVKETTEIPVQKNIYVKTTENTITEDRRGINKAKKIIYYMLGVIEALLICRFILKLLGANPVNTFVQIIYSVTGVLLWPFSGIFRTAVSAGIETKSYIEPAVIIAMIIYALVTWGIVRLIVILNSPGKNRNNL